MIIGIGLDVVEVERIARALARHGGRFGWRLFSPREQAYCRRGGPRQEAARFAARFAAKEALVKALGTGFTGGAWRDIEVAHDRAGGPRLCLSGEWASRAADAGVTRVLVSLTHTRQYAAAQVILWGDAR